MLSGRYRIVKLGPSKTHRVDLQTLRPLYESLQYFESTVTAAGGWRPVQTWHCADRWQFYPIAIRRISEMAGEEIDPNTTESLELFISLYGTRCRRGVRESHARMLAAKMLEGTK